jgi:oligoribonuclease NrnB/cAMP/cGMP phosphodiesterase (DHH superfamily)
MTTKIIYHQIKQGFNCPDGLAAAWVAHKYYGEAEVIGCWYQCLSEDLPTFQKGDRAVIVDFSFPADVLQGWSDEGVEILMIDHHKTAMEHLGDISQFSKHFKGQIKFDMQECGATLAWKHFFPDKPIPLFLQYVKDRDLWNKSLPSSDEIHEVASRMGRSFELYDLLESYGINSIAPVEFKVLSDLGSVLLAPKRKVIAAIAERATPTTFLDHKNIPIVLLARDGSEDRSTSDVCDHMYTNLFPDALFVACQTSDGTWSLKSNKNNSDGGFDVGALAKTQGGGGHRNVAGFKVLL